MESKMEVNKQEYAKKKFAEIRKQIQELIDTAQKIADETGEEFFFEPNNIGTYYPIGSKDNPNGSDGEWYPSSWSSSSIYC
jgi:hypothetical protein